MVMDAQPSPQSVGREFVRQYYTLLNKAPTHLHRFYNNHSSFIHGGLDTHNSEAPMVIGQKNIHNKIQQLNFRDCHAKISQVDAQATLGNGVVVQVTGELSNDGQPMRRFTQTFVLAAQSPKNYYVHNDIFRYQDLYSDDENDVESRSENDEEHETSESINSTNLMDSGNQVVSGDQQQPQPIPQQQIFYSIPQTVSAAVPRPSVTVVPNAVAAVSTIGQNVQYPSSAIVGGQQHQVNGIGHEDILQQVGGQMPSALPNVAATTANLNNQPQVVQSAALVQNTPLVAAIPSLSNVSPLPSQTTVAPSASLPHMDAESKSIQHELTNISDSPAPELKDDYKINDPIIEKLEATKITHEPKTYANLFKSITSTSVGSGFVPLPPASNQTSSMQSVYKPDARTETNQSSLPQRTNSTRINKDYSERRTSSAQFGDSHQLFLGNVPHHATEDELKVLFNKFGTVVDLRIHSKPGAKVPGMRNPPNYGFITYDDPEGVQNCLANCPLYFPENSSDGQKLNVEEKKTRVRTLNDLPRPNHMSNNSGLSGSSQRPTGGQNRSLSNSGGGMMRGSGGNGIVRGSSGAPRPNGGFNRNDSRGPGGPQSRGGNGNSASNTGSGNSYGRR